MNIQVKTFDSGQPMAKMIVIYNIPLAIEEVEDRQTIQGKTKNFSALYFIKYFTNLNKNKLIHYQT